MNANHIPQGKLFGNIQMSQFEDGAYGNPMEMVFSFWVVMMRTENGQTPGSWRM